MEDAGQELIVTIDGGVGSPEGLPSDQTEAWDLAFYVCVAQYPVDQTLFKQYGVEQIELLYQYYTDSLMPCLEAEGYTFDDVPSWETYRASWIDSEEGLYQSGDGWVPYDVFGDTSPQDWETLYVKCPQTPSDEFLFPEE